MSRWSVWQVGRGGAPERVGTYQSGADARRVLRSAIPMGAAVDPDGEVNEARGVSPAHIREIERAAETWLATAAAPTMPAPPAVIEIPEPVAAAAPEAPALPGPVRCGAVRLAPVVELRIDDDLRDLALDEYAGRTTAAEAFAVQAEKDLAALRDELDAARAKILALTAERDGLRIALDDARHPAKIVRLTAPPAPKPRRVRKAAGETPLGTIARRLAEIAEGRR